MGSHAEREAFVQSDGPSGPQSHVNEIGKEPEGRRPRVQVKVHVSCLEMSHIGVVSLVFFRGANQLKLKGTVRHIFLI